GGQVAEAHLDEVPEPAANFAQDQLGDRFGLTAPERQLGEEPLGFRDRQAVYVGDGEAPDAKVERLGAYPCARARRTQAVAPVARQEDSDVHAISSAPQPAEPASHAGIGAAPLPLR